MFRSANVTCIALLVSLAASTAYSQPLPAGPAPCRAIEFRPETPESDYRCSFSGGWSSLGAGYATLKIAPQTWLGMNWDQARFEFRNGQLKGANFWWTGDLASIDGWLRSRYGAAHDESHDGFFFYRYPETADGWQVTLAGGPTQWGVSYTAVSDLWR